jgi:hypothetical protein
LFRAQHPQSWWWTPQTDFLALILQAVQGGNWQRGGGKGRPPEAVKRPSDRRESIRTSDELKARRAAMDAELKRRRQRKLNKQRPTEQGA